MQPTSVCKANVTSKIYRTSLRYIIRQLTVSRYYNTGIRRITNASCACAYCEIRKYTGGVKSTCERACVRVCDCAIWFQLYAVASSSDQMHRLVTRWVTVNNIENL